MSSIMLQRICTTYAPIVARDCGNERGDVKTTPTTRGLSGKWPRWMTRGTGREARTQASPICRHIGDAEDAASRPVTPVRRPGSFSGQAPSAPSSNPSWAQLLEGALDSRSVGTAVTARRLFAPLGPTYDRYSALLSFGQDPRWRRFLVASVDAGAGD